jgi:IstB-like ATP binding protein
MQERTINHPQRPNDFEPCDRNQAIAPASRYERRSMLITANQPFGEWGEVFPDQAMTLAAIDRLVHHATILEMNVESYRRRAALDRKRGSGRSPAITHSRRSATIAFGQGRIRTPS